MERNAMIQELTKIVGKEDVMASEMEIQLYGYDASLNPGKPDCIVMPASTEEVSRVVRFAHENGIPVVARGSGTNLSGGSSPTKGGIAMLFTRMNKILEIDVDNQRVVVEPGAITLDIKNAIGKYGYLYHPDPSSEKATTIAGNLGENAGGAHCFKYGVTSNHVLGAEVVLADGTVVEVGGKSLDNPGFDLPGLLVGSEGTLGMVTKLVLRMMPKTEAVKTMLAVYDTIADGANTVTDIVKAGMIPTTLEMMDNLTIKAVEAAYHVGLPEDAASILLIELDGLADGMERLTEEVVAICKQNKVREVRVAKNDAERDKIWAGRKGAFGAVGRLRPNYLVNDPTVPRTKLPEALANVFEIGKKYNLPIANVFHAGDGNLHPLILFDQRDADEMDRVHKAAFEIMTMCAELGGTISGEHGIGVEKLRGMSYIFSPQDIEEMRKVKLAFDPTDLYNPGKLIPVEEAA